MKKSKKIPKTYLPKFPEGGTGGDATSNLYSDKRLTNTQKNSMYQALGAAGTSYATANNQAAYSDPNYKINNSSKGSWQSQGGSEGTADVVQSGVASAIPMASLFHGISEAGQSAVGTKGANAGSQYFFEPHKLITHAIDGEGLFNNKDREEHGLGSLNNLGSNIFSHGGLSQAPNAEIEKEENVVAPNGGFLQADGPSHDQGGVPVALPGNSMIFSDRLKLGKKTFADLNKANNTNKEDKILESNKYGSTSKSTAELMKMAKNKNSEALFNIQESLKKAKVEAYAKKMGVTLPQEEQSTEFPMGGVKLPMYPLGGPTDNTKYTPAQRQQAYNDSLTLYKSGFNKNVPNWQQEPGFNDAILRLHKLNGETPQSTDKRQITYDSNYLQSHSVPYAKPTVPVINTDAKKPMASTYSNVNMPMKGLERSDDFNPQLQQVPANSPSTIKTNIVTGPNMSYKEYKQGNEVLDRMYFNPETKKEIELTGFKYGGKLPKYEFGKLTPEEEGGDIESVWNNSSAKIDANHGWNSKGSNINQTLYDQELARMNAQANEKNSFDWKGLGSNIAMGLANNAGNIYNLSRYNKPEVEKYERMKATLLDPTAALRDAEMQNRRAEYNVRGASGGNAGTYLSNRVALNAQNTMNKARIHNEFQNANAGISNSVNQYNNELARQEVIANAMNRARNRSGKGEAIGSMGSNIANQMMDNKKTNMDQETLGLLMKYYDTPEFQRIMKEYKGKK